LAEALVRVVARDGFAGVSMRAVATEAGVSGGTVQYYFPNRAEMIRFAMEWTSAQVEQRISRISRWGEVDDWTREILLDLLPLSVERHRELAVWIAFVAHAETDPALAGLKRQTNEKLRALYTRIICARRGFPVHAEGSGSPGAEVENDALLLQSFLDGLALHLVDLEPQEAARVGPPLLDRYLALAVDTQATRNDRD